MKRNTSESFKQVNFVPFIDRAKFVLFITRYLSFFFLSFLASTLKRGNIANLNRKSFLDVREKLSRISIESSFFSEKVGSLFGKRSLIVPRAVRFAKKSNTLLVDFLDRTTRM